MGRGGPSGEQACGTDLWGGLHGTVGSFSGRITVGKSNQQNTGVEEPRGRANKFKSIGRMALVASTRAQKGH